MKRITPKVTKDELWKGIIEALFEDFLYFFFPDFVHEVDFTKPIEFLDKELQELIPDSESKNRRADLLAKVFLKSGHEKWILIHTEVQGYVDKFFDERMYIYNYRSYDRFKREIVALAILTDDDPNFHPSYYERKTWNTKIRYDFEVYKLLDHDIAEFELSLNPFATVMQIAKSFLNNKALKTDEDLLSLKLQLFRAMYKKGHDKDIIRKIANFIKLYVSFEDKNYFIKFETEIDKISKYQPTMGILELIKQRTLEEAERIGREEGLEEGLEKGLEEGLEKLKAERRKAITNMLAKDFSVEMIAGILEIPTLDVQLIEQTIALKTLFKEGLTVENVKEQFEENEQTILLAEDKLETLYQEVQVEQLLIEGFSVEEIVEKLDISEDFVLEIQKMKKK